MVSVVLAHTEDQSILFVDGAVVAQMTRGQPGKLSLDAIALRCAGNAKTTLITINLPYPPGYVPSWSEVQQRLRVSTPDAA